MARLASATGDLSPACATRTACSASRSPAAAIAATASASARSSVGAASGSPSPGTEVDMCCRLPTGTNELVRRASLGSQRIQFLPLTVRRGEGGRAGRKEEPHQRAAAGPAARTDRTTVRLHDAVGDEQPEPGAAAGRSAPELREHALLCVRPDPAALVRDAHLDTTVVRTDRDPHRPVAVP